MEQIYADFFQTDICYSISKIFIDRMINKW